MMGNLNILSRSSKAFHDRAEAGRLLAVELRDYKGKNAVVLGIPRGGIIVAREIAGAIGGELDIALAHKLRAPYQGELAIGAVAEDGRLFLNDYVTGELGISDAYIQQEKAAQLTEIKRRAALFRRARPKVALKDRVVIVTDDGIATGATFQAALWAARLEQPQKLVAAVPVGPEDTVTRLAADVDEMVCLRAPPFFEAVGQFYINFFAVEDEDVLNILKKKPVAANNSSEEGYVRLKADGAILHGNLIAPEHAAGLVVFAHGSGSGRHSPRNQYVAAVLREAGLGTLLFDLLTLDEEAEDLITGRQRFDIGLLARRLAGVTEWLLSNKETSGFKLGYFGASTGAAAALVAAAQKPEAIGAVVSRGGRPDLAGRALERVKAPTLLIVGGNDFPVIDMNRSALALLKAEKKMVIVPGATHLFEEPGALEKVAELARDWFVNHLGG